MLFNLELKEENTNAARVEYFPTFFLSREMDVAFNYRNYKHVLYFILFMSCRIGGIKNMYMALDACILSSPLWLSCLTQSIPG